MTWIHVFGELATGAKNFCFQPAEETVSPAKAVGRDQENLPLAVPLGFLDRCQEALGRLPDKAVACSW